MNKIKSVILMTLLTTIISGCASGSYILTGERRTAINPESVKLYSTPPQEFEVIGIVKASSDMGWTQQGDTNYAIAELKKQAGKIGANGIIIDGTGESTSTTVSTYGDNVAYSSSSTAQIITGKAIFVTTE